MGKVLRTAVCLLVVLCPIAFSVSGTHAAASGLVAAYGFNEGSGTTLTDLSGNGRTGTITGATWTTAGKYGGALTFNGSSSSVTIANDASLALASGYTLEAWVRPTSLGTMWRTVVLKEQSPPR